MALRSISLLCMGDDHDVSLKRSAQVRAGFQLLLLSLIGCSRTSCESIEPVQPNVRSEKAKAVAARGWPSSDLMSRIKEELAKYKGSVAAPVVPAPYDKHFELLTAFREGYDEAIRDGFHYGLAMPIVDFSPPESLTDSAWIAGYNEGLNRMKELIKQVEAEVIREYRSELRSP